MEASHKQFLCFLGLYLAVVVANFAFGHFAKLPDEVVRLRPARLPIQSRYSRLPAFLIFSWQTLTVFLGVSGFIGMALLWGIAPWVFLIGVSMKILHWPFEPWEARSGWDWMFTDLELFLDGVLLSFVFFGPFQHLFR